MVNVVSIHSKSVFSIDEANQILPSIIAITKKSRVEVNRLISKLDKKEDIEIEKMIDAEINKWQNKIESLGGRPKGLWLVDFDSGSGYFCWKFPENKISHHHGYDEGFSKRKIAD